ncbi:MAG: AzlD domain-containing protein [Oscillospiraceae bacterium]|nr:AzlD domain-containing protein [Oscillospiraceae bacterium]
MDYTRIFLCIAIMALVTYLPRMLPLAIFRKKIHNTFLQSFLHYVPYAVLAAMTFPEILYSTGNLISGLVGLAVAAVLAFFHRGLLTVAIGASASVFITEQIMHLVLG